MKSLKNMCLNAITDILIDNMLQGFFKSDYYHKCYSQRNIPDAQGYYCIRYLNSAREKLELPQNLYQQICIQIFNLEDKWKYKVFRC